METPSLPLRPPPSVSMVLAAERADLFLEGFSKLVGVLPWFVGGLVKGAVTAARQYLGDRDFELLDPWAWRQRGFDLSGGMGFWEASEGSLALAAVHRRTDAEQFLRQILRASNDAPRLVEEGEVTMRVCNDRVTGAFGFVGGFAWLSPVESREQALALSGLVASALDPGAEGEVAAILGALQAPRHALRLGKSTSGERLALAAAPGDREVRLSLAMPPDPEGVSAVGFLTRPGSLVGATVPRGTLAVLSGIDVGHVVRDVRQNDGRGGAEGARGMGVLTVHEIDPAFSKMVVDEADIDDILVAGVLHASLWARVHDEAQWRRWLRDEMDREGCRMEGKGGATTYAVPFDESKPGGPVLRLGFERGAMVGGLNDRDFEAARQAGRGLGESLDLAIEDPEARRLLERGEPLLYLKVAAAAERLGGLVSALWKEGSLGKSFGAHEALQLLRQIKDATGQAQVEADTPLRLWVKLRLR